MDALTSSKIKVFVKPDLLKPVYFAIFDSILRCAIQVCGQHRYQNIKEIEQIQKRPS